ncbi:uncharacterized protein VNE69_01269 [Vairimorpha necatrix]|uniref:Uncharacterized protein n=1 Tax=Vairimorpha necatrix TaxID=6039 RepID=A0AAX4J8R6_9MICR
MLIMHFFLMILFAQANHKLFYETIKNWWNEKIKCGDYWPLDTTKIYYQAYIKPRFQNSDGFHTRTSRQSFVWSIYEHENYLYTNIKYEKSSALKILVDEYEKELAKIWKEKKIDNFFLVYNVEDLNKYIDSSESITFKEVIEEIRKRNNERKETKTKDQFHFKEIYEEDKYKEKHFFEIIRNESEMNIGSEKYRNSSYTNLTYYSKKAVKYDGISFSRFLNNIHYCFYISNKEILDIVKRRLKEKESIYRMCFDLYEDIFFVRDPSIIADFFTSKKGDISCVTRPCMKDCESTELVKDKQSILQWYIKNDIKIPTDQKFYLESMEYLERIHGLIKNTNYKVIDAFNILLKSKEIEILIENIFMRSGDRPDALFGYFLVKDNIITKYDLNDLLKKKVFHKNRITPKISNNMRTKCNLIKIFLFFEAERYINEQEVVGKSFGILKEIGNTMENDLVESGKGPNQTAHLNLIDIMNTVIAKQSENIEVYGTYNIFNIISLLAESEFQEKNNYKTEYMKDANKNDIIKNLTLKKLK